MKKLLLLCSMSLMILATAYAQPSTAQKSGYQIGDTAEDFKLLNVSGHMISLKDYGSMSGYVIVFTCNHCPYSVMYEDRLIELHKQTAEMGYPIIAINPNDPELYKEDSYEAMQVRHKEKGFPFTYLFDEGQQVYPKFGATKTPHVFILDADRKVRYIGAIDDNARDESAVTVNYVLEAIKAIEAGNNPDPAETKAIGCSIKVKK